MTLNLLTAKLFGELEFWFAIIKVITIIALILVGIFLIIIQFKTPFGHASLTHLWSHGGWFPNGINGFLLSFQMAVFSFVGIELIGVTAGEAQDQKNVTKSNQQCTDSYHLILRGCFNHYHEYHALGRSIQNSAHSLSSSK